jgi:hypothetical protein
MLNNKKQIHFTHQQINKSFVNKLPQISKNFYAQTLNANLNNLPLILDNNNKIKNFRLIFLNDAYRRFFLFNKFSIKSNKKSAYISNIVFLHRLCTQNILYPNFYARFKKKRLMTTSLGCTSLLVKNQTKTKVQILTIKIKKKRFAFKFFFKFNIVSNV